MARGTFPADVAKLLAAQTRQRDRVALLLLFRLGLRKGELARVQFQHYDGRNLTVFGKAGKVRCLLVVDSQLRLELERHILDRKPAGGEFLLCPEKLGPTRRHGQPEIGADARRSRRHRHDREHLRPPRDGAAGAERGLAMRGGIVPTGNPVLQRRWRRRESNPRPRSHRSELLQA